MIEDLEIESVPGKTNDAESNVKRNVNEIESETELGTECESKSDESARAAIATMRIKRGRGNAMRDQLHPPRHTGEVEAIAKSIIVVANCLSCLSDAIRRPNFASRLLKMSCCVDYIEMFSAIQI